MIDHGGLAATLVQAVVVFVVTNIDAIVLLSLFFADPTLPRHAIVAGQYRGIGILVLVSAAAGIASVAVPPEWTALLGAIPLAVGLYKGVFVIRARGEDGDDDVTKSKLASSSRVLAVAGVTLANGADNLSVYIPLFAANRRWIGVYAAVFGVLTAIGCALGSKWVESSLVGHKLRRYGHIVLPIVLVVLGIHILAGARSLVWR
jgi:cadmium resistance protein CadD (predicted permease)